MPVKGRYKPGDSVHSSIKPGYMRMTLVISEENNKWLSDYAYTERLTRTDALERIINDARNNCDLPLLDAPKRTRRTKTK